LNNLPFLPLLLINLFGIKKLFAYVVLKKFVSQLIPKLKIIVFIT